MNLGRHDVYNIHNFLHWLARLWTRLRQTVKINLHIQPFSLIGLVIFGGFIVCIVTCMPLICCCNRKTRKNSKRLTTSRSKQAVNRTREEEIQTPLVNTCPDENKEPQQLEQHLSHESPPPPRRSTGGRTLIVPLNGSSYRLIGVKTKLADRSQGTPLLGTPDSRVTSFEAGTTKSCATIPEDDELELDEDIYVYNNNRNSNPPECDLISIDRTYVSTRDSRSLVNRTRNYSVLADPLPQPLYKLNPPPYTPPEPPPPPDTAHSTPARRSNITSHHITTTLGQSNLSSPDASSLGFGSIMETTGSGSYAITMESEDRARIYYEKGEKNYITELDESSADTNFRNAVLHRIEEEESNFEDPSSIGRFLGSPSGSGLSNKYNQTNLMGSFHRIPRSISQQLELMNGTRLNS
ncbi:unnamed protein product [Bursaphelenchus xylophilus]|uniref:(pine wood nematode) hypothetical protein n=1 Tax=Bursaphelenchus xylophilus TaxID=6326 RepID=A0A811KHD5_BURXY|nr:unnamed protein product [Bursaphelenchus xylophilus]CAG9097667.1 unnamed protein product [Bursaphelenchus xylophilus]